MPPSDSDTTDDSDGLPDYYTPDRLVSYAILGSARQALNYRYLLVRNAGRTINEIQASRLDRWEPVVEGNRQNLVRALNAQIVQETVAIIESLAAISMNPDDPPEERAKQLLKYRSYEIHNFYDDIDADTDQDFFASIFSYPAVEDLGISDATGTPAGNLLIPLHDVVDLDALDQLFTGCDTDGKVMFAYKEFTVTATSDGRVQVTN